jgi:hypothetical protein
VIAGYDWLTGSTTPTIEDKEREVKRQLAGKDD